MRPPRTGRATRLAWLPTFLGVLALAAIGQARAQNPARDQQVAEIQKQIEELSKKLDALKKSGGAKPEIKTDTLALGPEWVKPLAWRPIGPASMGGRVVALAVAADDPSTYWVATGGGGLLKTTNNGITFEHQFDKESTVAVGDVCVAPSNKEVVWVGTGENNPRNSVSYGDGVYKSTDGGKTWTNMGLKGTYQVGRIAIHPKNPDVVYVGALGRLYGPSEERGLFKTADGGKTWDKVLYVDDRTGVVDLRLHPTDPETLLVATYERLRGLYDVGDPSKKFGPGSAIHKSTDGGKTFKKLTRGLPTVNLGRVGLDYSRKDPNTVFAVVESEKIGSGPRPKGASAKGQPQAYVGVLGEGPEAPGATVGQVLPGGPADKAGLKTGDLITEADGKPVKTFNDFAGLVRDKKVGETLKVKVEREGKPVEAEITLEARPATPATGQGREPGPPENESGGGLGLNPDRPFGAALGGQIENAQDRQGADAFQTGGVYKSTDGGESWTRVNSLNPRPFYFSQVRVDPNDDQNVYVLGLVVHRSTDGGKTFRGDASRGVHADHHALWIDPRDVSPMVLN
ncbi:MAG: PDZ domain-containing protein, partial [Planctomycetia bacterium]|nr:PDZ domain-containing protein [Planctomycetia bacterium]